MVGCLSSAVASVDDTPIDSSSGLKITSGWELVKKHCTSCHSSRTITQNRMNKEGWLETIRWMQKTQGLWALGDAEPIILDYLANSYAINARDQSKRKSLPSGKR